MDTHRQLTTHSNTHESHYTQAIDFRNVFKLSPSLETSVYWCKLLRKKSCYLDHNKQEVLMTEYRFLQIYRDTHCQLTTHGNTHESHYTQAIDFVNVLKLSPSLTTSVYWC